MNKAEFVAVVAEKAGLTKTDAGKAVDAVLEAVSETLVKGYEIKFPGFGTFEVTEQAARMGRNPRTGEAIKIAASRAPKFRAGTQLKKAVGGVEA